MPLLLLSPEVLVNGPSRRQALGQEMSNSCCFKIRDFKKGFFSGEMGKIRPQAQIKRIGWIYPTFSCSTGCCLLPQYPLGILLKGMSAVKRIQSDSSVHSLYREFGPQHVPGDLC